MTQESSGPGQTAAGPCVTGPQTPVCSTHVWRETGPQHYQIGENFKEQINIQKLSKIPKAPVSTLCDSKVLLLPQYLEIVGENDNRNVLLMRVLCTERSQPKFSLD